MSEITLFLRPGQTNLNSGVLGIITEGNKGFLFTTNPPYRNIYLGDPSAFVGDDWARPWLEEWMIRHVTMAIEHFGLEKLFCSHPHALNEAFVERGIVLVAEQPKVYRELFDELVVRHAF